jgi:tripartite-type tricarboxylate transporter receptor subunit TctC
MVSGMQGALPQIKAEKIRALAVTGMRRSPALPDVPTVNEALGLRDYEALNWQSLLFPAGTPKPIVNKLQMEIAKALKSKDDSKKMLDDGAILVGDTPEQFDVFIRAEQKRWANVVEKAKISID